MINENIKLPIVPKNFDDIVFPYVDDNDWVWFAEDWVVYRWVGQTWSCRNKSHYTNLGYFFTKMKDFFWVDVRDLSNSETTIVYTFCQNCNIIETFRWQAVYNKKHTKCSGRDVLSKNSIFSYINYTIKDDFIYADNIIISRGCKNSWNATTKSYYESLGYIFTNYGDSFLVDIRDLTGGSSIPVTMICPDCGKKYTRPFKMLGKRGHHTFCKKCKLFHINYKGDDLIGNTFNRLTVLLRLEEKDKHGNYCYLCLCECDNYTVVTGSSIRNNYIRSCGCLQRESSSLSGENNPNWKGGWVDHYYGPNWQEQRALARERDEYCCRRCGLPEADNERELDVHHWTPFRSFNYIPGENDYYIEANDLSNLVSLCRKNGCHMIVENNPDRLYDYYNV